MPKSVAIIGASRDRAKFGNKAVRAYQRVGYRVYPIHPREKMIEGLPAYAGLAEIPGRIDRVALYVPPHVGLTLIDQIAAANPRELYVNPGTGSPELLAAARARGLAPIEACAIRAIGIDPRELDPPPADPSEEERA